MTDTNTLDFLKSLDYLRKVSDDLLCEIAGQMQIMDVSTGATIFQEGDDGDAVYLVVSGTLSIEHDGTRLVTRGPGELVGEFALIDDHTRSATVVAVGDVRLLKWMRDDFTVALSRSVDLVRGVLSTITEKLRESTKAHYDSLQLETSENPEAVDLPGTDWVPEKTVIYQSASMRGIFSLINKISDSSGSILITGETGTGKEVIARAVHHTSPYRDGPFVALNCGALPETLAESELFGHERGSFTGAAKEQKGKIELAHRGTLFLDEIGELPPALQVKLLRVLDDGRVLRIGATKPIATDFRVIAATNRDILREIDEGHFREDIFYRLAVMTIHIPPLRERPDDIPPLAEQFLTEIAGQTGLTRRFSADVVGYLMQQHWRGNVRELRNAVERAVMISGDEWIELDDIRGVGQPYTAHASSLPKAVYAGTLEGLLQELNLQDQGTNVLELVEMVLIELAMNQSGRNMSQAANLLGINYKQVARRLQKYETNQDGE